LLLANMEDATAVFAMASFPSKLNSISGPLRKTFTYNQGKVMTRHTELSTDTSRGPGT
jgi:IS30 family transposase